MIFPAKLPPDHPWPRLVSTDASECEKRLDNYIIFMSDRYDIPIDLADQDSFKAGFAAALDYVKNAIAGSLDRGQ